MTALKKHKSQRRANSRRKGIADLSTLADYSVVPFNEGTQFRVNGVLDLYPTNRRFHNLRTNERGDYPSGPPGELTAFVELQIGKAAAVKPRSRAYGKGRCVFCGGEAALRLCEECQTQPAHVLIRAAKGGWRLGAIREVACSRALYFLTLYSVTRLG